MRRVLRVTFMMAVAASVAVVVAPETTASPIVDQSFTAPYDLADGFGGPPACRYTGQSFTAGITGRLTGVNIDVHRIEGLPFKAEPPMRVAIRRVEEGVPVGDPLGVRLLWRTQSRMWQLITFDANIQLVAGRRYAIVVSYRKTEDGVIGWWAGAVYNLYRRGDRLNGGCPEHEGSFWIAHDYDDLHFRTYVDPAA